MHLNLGTLTVETNRQIDIPYGKELDPSLFLVVETITSEMNLYFPGPSVDFADGTVTIEGKLMELNLANSYNVKINYDVSKNDTQPLLKIEVSCQDNTIDKGVLEIKSASYLEAAVFAPIGQRLGFSIPKFDKKLSFGNKLRGIYTLSRKAEFEPVSAKSVINQIADLCDLPLHYVGSES